MICTVIQKRGYEEILRILDDPYVEMAEIRLDLCQLSDEEIEDIFSNSDTPLIATCRAEKLGETEAERRLTIAIRSGARYADLELEASAGFSKRFRSLCHECGTEIIRSYHDFKGTPDPKMLQLIVARCYRYGADIAKIVTNYTVPRDATDIIALYDQVLDGDVPIDASRLVAFTMGDKGRDTRLECLRKGAPFTYAALSQEDCTAAGQWDFESLHKAVYGNFKGFWRNSLEMPASKSFAQRAIIAAALAEGRSRLRKYSPCEDSESALSVARTLGATVRKEGSTIVIDGIGAGARTHLEELCTGESGLLTRLCIPLMAVLNDGPVTVTGEKTLLQRPLKGVADIMAAFGVPIRSDRVPIRVEGPLIPGNAEISGKDGSQLISGLLAALPLCDRPSTVYVDEPKSIPYMFITCDVLSKFGIKISSEMEGDEKMIEEQDWSGCTEVTFKVKGGQHYRAADFDIEADWSSAANFLVAGAVFGKAEVSGLDTSSLQADISIADILVQAGAVVSEMDDLVCVSKAPLEPFETDLNNAPDIFPIVSVLAAFCSGDSVIAGLGRLRGKESDRAAAIVDMLHGLGVTCRVEDDSLIVSGEALTSRLLNGRMLRGGHFTSRHDHRMAMALRIAALGASSPVVIDDSECVAKSFPGFFELFDAQSFTETASPE